MLASVPGLPRSVRVLIMCRRQTFEKRGLARLVSCAPRALAVGARRSRTVLDRARGLEENRAGPSGGGGGKRGIFNHSGLGQACWAFRAWESGGG